MARCTIYWGQGGFAISGLRMCELHTATTAIQSVRKDGYDPDKLTQENAGIILELLAVELRAQDVTVQIQLAPGHLLKHAACGTLFTSGEWSALPSVEHKIQALTNGKEVSSPMRNCKCGSTVSCASLRVIAADDLRNSKTIGAA